MQKSEAVRLPQFQGHGLRDTCLLQLRDTVMENGEVRGQLAAITSPIFLYEMETSRCRPAFSGLDLAKRSATVRPSWYDFRASARLPCAISTSPTLL